MENKLDAKSDLNDNKDSIYIFIYIPRVIKSIQKRSKNGLISQVNNASAKPGPIFRRNIPKAKEAREPNNHT